MDLESKINAYAKSLTSAPIETGFVKGDFLIRKEIEEELEKTKGHLALDKFICKLCEGLTRPEEMAEVAEDLLTEMINSKLLTDAQLERMAASDSIDALRNVFSFIWIDQNEFTENQNELLKKLGVLDLEGHLQKFIDGVLQVPDECIDTRKYKDGTVEKTLNVPQHVFDIECEIMFYLADNYLKYKIADLVTHVFTSAKRDVEISYFAIRFLEDLFYENLLSGEDLQILRDRSQGTCPAIKEAFSYIWTSPDTNEWTELQTKMMIELGAPRFYGYKSAK